MLKMEYKKPTAWREDGKNRMRPSSLPLKDAVAETRERAVSLNL